MAQHSKPPTQGSEYQQYPYPQDPQPQRPGGRPPVQPPKKKMAKWKIVLIAIVGLLAVSGLYNGLTGGPKEKEADEPAAKVAEPQEPQKSDPEPAKEPEEPAKKTLGDTLEKFGAFEETTVTDVGDDVVEIPCQGMPCLIALSHNGSSNFVVKTVDSGGESVDLLVNTIGAYDGTVTDYEAFQNASMLEVSADGEWSATFYPMSAMTLASSGDSFSGDNVVGIDSESSITKVSFSNSGESNFVVKGIGMSSSKLLVNEIGAYDGTVVWNEPQSFLIVKSDGDWTVEF